MNPPPTDLSPAFSAAPILARVDKRRRELDEKWGSLPVNVKKFILGTPDGAFSSNLIEFWSSPQNIGFTRGESANRMCRATWDLALMYLELSMHKEARALTTTGAFLYQCYKTSLEYVKPLCTPGANIPYRKMPYFVAGVTSTRSSDEMIRYIKKYFPKESLRSITNRATQIKLILVDDATEDECHFHIPLSTTLKSLFNHYANENGKSLRSLRFSYNCDVLFLSSAGRKTPEELGMQDQDVIVVVDTSKPRESSNDNSSSEQTPTPKMNKAKKQSMKKAKGKTKRQVRHEEPVKTLEEYKVHHSKQLTKIHEEAQARFKRIRQRLNNLAIERSQRKIKSKRSGTPKNEPIPPSTANGILKEGIGGKAGKCRYEIQVGEVGNLYKTTKPSVVASHSGLPGTLPTLDLHGCTREEALKKLDDSLKVWVDAAMKAPYPFVQRAVIVCGCGSQILSETVQRWIRSNDKVSNAPKVRSSRR